MIDVYLYKVGRNLNRAYRTCEFFGVKKIYLVGCMGKLSGNLFKAKDNVSLIQKNSLPDDKQTVYFETNGGINIHEFDFSGVEKICVGGESNNLPKNKESKRIKICKSGNISGLTTEGALSIALYEIWRQNAERS